MYLEELVAELDNFFQVETFQPDVPFSSLVPSVYRKANIGLKEFFRSSFLDRFHGLTVHNGSIIDRIYSVVFLSEEVLDKILTGGRREALVITHHPLMMETSNRGFLPISREHLSVMQSRGISVYTLHTPLDVHWSISPSRALSRVLGLGEVKQCSQVSGGYAGVYGQLSNPMEFEEFLGRVMSTTGVTDPNFIRKHRVVQMIGVLAGGIDVDGIKEVTSLGCDVLVTGTYYNLVQDEIGRRYREEFDSYRDELSVSLIECSHYASESIVMKTDILELCARFGIESEFIPQDNPWE
jgi:putative NIF3 family GTP cyclohydrolase 1 type 2